jgi:hypothetical protein
VAAPEKYEFSVGTDSFRFLFAYENRDVVLYQLVDGQLKEIDSMMSQRIQYQGVLFPHF